MIRRLVIIGVLATACAPAGTSTTSARWTDDEAVLLHAMLAAEDARAGSEETLAPLLTGLEAENVEVRRIAVRGLGRLQQPALLRRIAPLLEDSSPSVRAEAANAAAQAVWDGGADQAWALLRPRLAAETDPPVVGALAHALGRLPYESEEAREQAELALSGLGGNAPTTRLPLRGYELGLARGLEALVRGAPSRSVDDSTRELLHEMATLGAPGGGDEDRPEVRRIRRLAVATLDRAGGAETALLRSAAADFDTEVRRLAAAAAGRLPGGEARNALLREALDDDAASVRFQALQAAGPPVAGDNAGCARVRGMLDDPSSHVRLLVIDLLSSCGFDPGARQNLVALADLLPEVEPEGWHAAAHALVSLTGAAPDEARSRLPAAAGHGVWQVRMYAARAATNLDGIDTLAALAADPHPNVSEAALAGLIRLGVANAHATSFVSALQRDDYQLLITAARGLEGHDAAAAVPALLDALDRVSARRRETSRDPRRALLERIAEQAGPEHGDRLEAYLTDFDPVIAEIAATILEEWTGEPRAASPQPLPREPVPSIADLERLERARAVIEMRSGGTVELRLLPLAAPTNAARFARLAAAGHFDGLTFHRVVPNFVIQGGSPGANEYMGDGPYTRDELASRSHLRGTVGLSTRGRDTGDGQIFVNMVDNVRLDHNYTIFAEVISGMDVVDGVLEGAVIERIRIVDSEEEA